MELTEVIQPPFIIKNSLPNVMNTADRSETEPVNLEIDEEQAKNSQTKDFEEKAINCSQNRDKLHLKIIDTHNNSIQNVSITSTCEEKEDRFPKNCESFLNSSPSPLKLMRHRKPVEYKIFFTSDDSDNDSSPKKASSVKNNKSNNIADLKSKSYEKASNITTDRLSIKKTSSDGVNKGTTDLSVFDLDVSDSKMQKNRRKIKTSRSKNGTQKKELYKPTLKLVPSIPPQDTLSIRSSNIAQNNFKKGFQTSQQIKNVRKSILSISKCADKMEDNRLSSNPNQDTPRSKDKRVSFAAIDQILMFDTMNNAENKTIRCFSKSTEEIEITSFPKTIFDVDTDIPNTITSSSNAGTSANLNFSDDTELYAFPLNTYVNAQTDSHQQPGQTIDSGVTEQSENKNNDRKDDQSSETNKISQELPQYTGEEINASEVLKQNSYPITSLRRHVLDEIGTNLEVGSTDTVKCSDDTELYTLNDCIIPQTDNTEAPSQSILSALTKQSKSKCNNTEDDLCSKKIKILKKKLPKKADKESNGYVCIIATKNEEKSNSSFQPIISKVTEQSKIKHVSRKDDQSAKESKISQKEISIKVDKETDVSKCVAEVEEKSNASSQPIISEQSKNKCTSRKNDRSSKKIRLSQKELPPQNTEEETNSSKCIAKIKEKLNPNPVLEIDCLTLKENETEAFNLSGETELYAFPLNVCKNTKPDNVQSSQSIISAETEQSADNHIITETKESPHKIDRESDDFQPDYTKTVTKAKNKKLISCDDLKENNPDYQTMDISINDLHIKSKLSEKSSHLSSSTKKTQNKSSNRRKVSKVIKTSSGNPKKSSINTRSIQSSPVLKDVLNLEEREENIILPKRRSKVAISYKEPTLNKKMRRE